MQTELARTSWDLLGKGSVIKQERDRGFCSDFSPAFNTLQLHAGTDKLHSHLKLNLNVAGRVLDLFIYRSQCVSFHSAAHEEQCKYIQRCFNFATLIPIKSIIGCNTGWVILWSCVAKNWRNIKNHKLSFSFIVQKNKQKTHLTSSETRIWLDILTENTYS